MNRVPYVKRIGLRWCVVSPFGSVMSKHITRRGAERFAVGCVALVNGWAALSAEGERA